MTEPTGTHDGHGEVATARRCLAALATLKDLDGPASPEQRETLAGWAGWGPLAKAFEWTSPGSTWAQIQTEALELLTPAETEAAKLAVDTAFYTTPLVTDAIWGILTGLGFTGGRVLEPGCGAGAFIGATPAGVDVDWTGVEADPVTAAIATALHPDADVVGGRLEHTPLRRGAFDAAVGNVPFSKAGPYDPAAPEGMSLHNYFIWRALCAVRPGGIVALVTSRYTMDARAETRAPLGELADLAGAVRLPGEAFATLGTSVVADILVLRRRWPGEEPAGAAWLDEPQDCGIEGQRVNPYWLASPAMVAGELTVRHGHAYGHTLGVSVPEGADLAGLLETAARKLVTAALGAGLGWEPSPAGMDTVVLDAEAGKDGAFTVEPDGSVTQLRDGKPVKVRAAAELVSLVRLRDLALALFAAEADPHMPGVERGVVRQDTRAAYEAYVAAFGPLNRCTLTEGKPDEDGFPVVVRRRPTMGGFRGDPDYPTVLALEVWDDDTATAAPAAILLRHVNQAPQRKTHTDDPGEALLLCLDQVGRVDLGVIAGLLSVPEAEVPGLLAGQLWEDPASGEWVTTDEYLSGNVRVKLAQARAAAGTDPGRYSANVTALEGAQPADLGPEEISAQLGSPWIPPGDIERFATELLGVYRHEGAVTVKFEPYTSTWEVKASTQIRQKPAAYATWGTSQVNAVNLIEDGLNGTSPVVYDLVKDADGNDRRVRNQAETALAADKLRDLQERFASWVWEDPARAERLCTVYNERFNATRLRRYDGTLLSFPGLAGGFTPYQSQRDMAWRIACTPAALCGYSVGAGKTATMVLSAFLLRRLGLARKPCMVVPNHLLEQECAEARRLYPGGRILMVTKDDLTPTRRKGFLAKVAASDWDLVLMTHQQFAAIPASALTQADYIAGLIQELEAATMDSTLEGTRTAKRLARRKKALIARHEELLDSRRDDGLTWEQTGIDVVLIDEAHMFKNLGMASRAEGFSVTGSKRADDLMMKLSYLRGRNPDGRCGYLFTGTPLSNSLAELYVMLRYLAPDLLADRRLESFDGFAAQFIRYTTSTEVAPDGSGFRQYRRPARYANVPELRAMLGEVADIRTRADLGIDGPEVTAEHIAVPASEALAEFTAGLVERADRIRSGGVTPEEDNMLAICTDGRRAALDLSLVGVEPDSPGKVAAVVAKAAALYRATAARAYPDTDGGALFGPQAGGLQIVFCDQGTPSPEKGDQVYGRIRDGLVAAGVRAGRIAFIHDAQTGADRAALFARCRDGLVSVLLGSTEKCGTGVNIQRRCAAVHHVDAPWRPADVEQREGRGNRPGNAHGTLRVVRYVTEGSFDAYMWQGLERKARFIGQILTGDLAAREVDDAGNPAVLTYAEMKAAASGQPLLLELAEVNAEVARLRNQASGHKRAQARMRDDQRHHQAAAHSHQCNASVLLEIAGAAEGAPRKLSRWGKPLGTGDAAAAEALHTAVTAARAQRHEQHIGTWRGVEVRAETERRYPSGKPVVSLAVSLSAGWSSTPYRFTPAGNVWTKPGAGLLLNQIDQVIDSAAEWAATEAAHAASALERADAAGAGLGDPFPREMDLQAALLRRREVEALIDAEVAPPAAESSEVAA